MLYQLDNVLYKKIIHNTHKNHKVKEEIKDMQEKYEENYKTLLKDIKPQINPEIYHGHE